MALTQEQQVKTNEAWEKVTAETTVEIVKQSGKQRLVEETVNVGALFTASETVLRAYALSGMKLAAVAAKDAGEYGSVQEALDAIASEGITPGYRGITPSFRVVAEGVHRRTAKEKLMDDLKASTAGMTPKQVQAYLVENGFIAAPVAAAASA